MPSNQTSSESLETRIGLYWLHRLGIITLVFGVVFLITYSFQFWGPCLKLLIGFAVSGALLLLGEKMAGRKNQKWFAYGLSAGGWSLAYFTAYAAYYIPSVQVIHSLPAETLLLMTVATGSLFNALRARSEVMAIYSITLEAVTIMMNGPGLFSDVSFLIIAIATAVLGNVQSWRKLFAFGLAACYIGHWYCSWTYVEYSLAQAGSLGMTAQVMFSNMLLAMAFVSLIWLAFTIGIGYSTRTPENARNFITSLACVNGMALAVGLSIFNEPGLSELRQILLVAAGLIYLATSRWLEKRNQQQLRTVHSLLGLFLINSAKVMRFSGMTLLSVDIIQIALLAIVGMKYNIKSFRWFALVLSALFIPTWLSASTADLNDVVFGFSSFAYVRVGLLAAGVLAAIADAHMRNEKGFYPYFYYVAANLMCAGICFDIIDPSWRAFACALLAVCNYAIGMRQKNAFYTAVGFTAFAFSANIAVANYPNWHTVPLLLSTAAFFAGYALFRLRPQMPASSPAQATNSDPSQEKDNVKQEPLNETVADLLHWAFALVGNILLTALLMQKLPGDYVSLGLGVEGIVMLLAGFLTTEPFFRISGLTVLGLLTGKLLFVDMAQHNTLERILSFIGAGVVFLVSSYGYGRFTHSFDDGVKAPVDDPPSDGIAGTDANLQQDENPATPQDGSPAGNFC